MRSWAVYDRRGKYLFHITASTADEALSDARKADRNAYKVELVIDRERQWEH